MTKKTGSNIAAPSLEEIERALKSMIGKSKAVAEATSKLRSNIKAIIERTGWHKKALGDIKTIAAMSPEERVAYLATLEGMLEIMSPIWHAEVTDLLSGMETGAGTTVA